MLFIDNPLRSKDYFFGNWFRFTYKFFEKAKLTFLPYLVVLCEEKHSNVLCVEKDHLQKTQNL